MKPHSVKKVPAVVVLNQIAVDWYPGFDFLADSLLHSPCSALEFLLNCINMNKNNHIIN